MAFNGVMAVVLRYFTEFVYDVVGKHYYRPTAVSNLLLILYDHINTVCAIAQRLFWQKQRGQWPSLQTVVAYAPVS